MAAMHSDGGVSTSARAAERGFTLIELMIVVAAVAILAAIAVPSYQYAIIKARRSAAQGCLTEEAQRLERYYTVNMSYTNASAPTCGNDVTPHYKISFSGTPDASGYLLKIDPLGRQATAETMCGSMTMDQTGKKTGATSDCWK